MEISDTPSEPGNRHPPLDHMGKLCLSVLFITSSVFVCHVCYSHVASICVVLSCTGFVQHAHDTC